MAGLHLVTAPDAEPVDLAEAKAYLVVDFNDDDVLIDALIQSARSHCEAFLKMSLMSTVWDYRIDLGFPREIRLPIGPLSDVAAAAVAITYTDLAGVTQTLDSVAFQVSGGDTPVIRPAYGATWPATLPVLDAVRVRFTAGHATADDIPRAVRVAVLMTLGDLYEQRQSAVVGGSASSVPLAARNLMMPFVRFS